MIPADTSWLIDPAAQAVCAAVEAAGFAIYFVGGCVRNALLGLADSDVDMSTNARPEQVIQIAETAGFKAIPTGIDHGTITVVAGGAAFEITTFRRDVATDGRRAVVAFSDEIKDDARRRDFTMNALYADRLGRVLDPLGGMADLLARQVRFIEDPEARIKEDYLRILRFFRFSAWYADPDQGFGSEALAAIARNTDGLDRLSAERIGQEVTKLLAAENPAPAVATMRQVNVLNAILPGSDDRYLGILVHLESSLALPSRWITRLAILGGENADTRLRLSKADARMLALAKDLAYAGPSLSEIAYREGAEMAQSAFLLRTALSETEADSSVLETILAASAEVFPVTAKDLMPGYQGPALGAKLKELEQLWIASGFNLSKELLLSKS